MVVDNCTEFCSFDVVLAAVVNFPFWELEFTIGRSEPEKQIGGCYWLNP